MAKKNSEIICYRKRHINFVQSLIIMTIDDGRELKYLLDTISYFIS